MSLLMHKVAHATSECNELAKVLEAVVRKVGQRSSPAETPLDRDSPGQRTPWTGTPTLDKVEQFGKLDAKISNSKAKNPGLRIYI